MSLANHPAPLEAGTKKLAAIVLAAGFSSRMAEFKPMLPLAGSTALERCIGIFRNIGVDEVIVVLGHRGDELLPLVERCGARCAGNPNYEQGMFSSIAIGSRALPGWAEAAFVLPADIPLVRAGTIRQMAGIFIEQRPGIVYPVFNGRRGHPPLIAGRILAEAAKEGALGPLSDLLMRHESEAVNLSVVDQCIHMDMDTPADYDELRVLAACREIPTHAECEAILAGQRVDASIVLHSRVVARVAGLIANALVRSGMSLNAELAVAGAMLHDLAKGEPEHAAAGASLLRRMDFTQVAAIVSAHTDYDFDNDIDESAIVYLADKLVRGEELVTIDQRFQVAFERFHDDPVAFEAARKRNAIVKKVAQAVEMRTGVSIASLLNEAGKS